MKTTTITTLVIFFITTASFFTNRSYAQTKPITIQGALNTAMQNNLQLKSANLSVQQQSALQRTAFDVPRTEITMQQDAADGGSQGNSIGIVQPFALPIVYKNQANLLQQQTLLAQREKIIVQFDITRQVRLAYINFQFGYERIRLLNSLDSIYRKFKERAELRQQVGETSNLEKYAAQNKFYEIQLLIKQAKIDVRTNELLLQQLLNTKETLQPVDTTLIKIPFDFTFDSTLSSHPQTAFFQQQLAVANAELQLEKSKRLPDFNVGYFHQFLIKGFDPAKINREYTPNTRIGGFQIGITVPLFFGAQRAKVNAAKINTTLIQAQAQAAKAGLQTQYLTQYNEYLKQKEGLDYYETIGLKQTDEIIRISQISYKLGEIGYMEYIQNLTMAFDTKLKYLEALNLYNQAIIELNYVNGKQ
jgi:cobalt-zinc-cadmium resistance protein CzcA